MHADEVDIDDTLVRRLLVDQMPQLADRPLTIVEHWGTDNALWRLGADLVVRLPRIPGARQQADKEATWLPRIAPYLAAEVPEPVAVGAPALGYPYRWAIHRWIDGRPAGPASITDPVRFAVDLATAVRELQTVPTAGAPRATHRARPLADYDAAARAAIAGAARLVDERAALAVWEDALAAPEYDGPDVWVHGDLEANCLVDDAGRLRGIVDWNSACIGDPAVDVQVIWSPLVSDESRDVFLRTSGVDAAAVRRSRGTAIHQACAALPYYLETYPAIVERSWHKLARLGIAGRGR